MGRALHQQQRTSMHLEHCLSFPRVPFRCPPATPLVRLPSAPPCTNRRVSRGRAITPALPEALEMEPSAASKLGQNFNSAGISLFLKLLWGNQSLALPHLSVPDISSVNWPALRQAGFKGVVFDKDNTLTLPFKMEVEHNLQPSLQACKEAFGGKVVLYSNSAGLKQYDPEGREATALEQAMGIHVLRHADKKPAGGSAELESYFGCPVSELVMVGDRYLTDVVFGNRHGMLTIRPKAFTTEGEPAGVLLARGIEESFVGRWTAQGLKAPPHRLLLKEGGPACFLIGIPTPPARDQGAAPAVGTEGAKPDDKSGKKEMKPFWY